MEWISKSRYRGTVLLSAGIFSVGFFELLWNRSQELPFPEAESVREETRILDSLLAVMPEESREEKSESSGNGYAEEIAGEFRPAAFNPNKVSQSEWLAMGLPRKAFLSLERYRQKGGIFRSKEQLFKIPHLPPAMAEELQSYVQAESIAAKEKQGGNQVEKKQGPLAPFNLNTADSLQLKKVFGIGAKTASRILRYRNDLGGFCRKEQLYEIWGLDSLVAEELMEASFLAEPPELRKINPNTAGEEELGRHPYIRPGLARLMLRYRKQHAAFAAPEDLLGIRLFRKEQLEKLRPYLVF